MKALRTKICTYAIALLTSLGLATTSAQAGSADFAGIYGALNASAGGAQISGTHTGGSTNEVNEGKVGVVFPMAGYEVGFNLPLGPVFFLGAGHSWTKGVTATLAEGAEETASSGGSNKAGSDDGTAAASITSFSLKASDLKEVYIMPSISIYDNSAVYVKLGRAIADLDLTGSVTGTPNNLTGNLVGIGTIAMTPSGIFIKTEGSVTRFDDIKVVGVADSASAYVEGTPDVVQGTVAIGFKF